MIFGASRFARVLPHRTSAGQGIIYSADESPTEVGADYFEIDGKLGARLYPELLREESTEKNLKLSADRRLVFKRHVIGIP